MFLRRPMRLGYRRVGSRRIPSHAFAGIAFICVTASLVAALPTGVPAQQVADTSYAVLDSMFSIVRETSLHRANANWPEIEATFRAEVEAAGSFDEALDAFRGVFRELDDVHSAVYYAGRGIGYSRADDSELDVEALIQESRARVGQPDGQLLAGGVGYVFVPSYAPRGQDAIDLASRGLRDVVCDLFPDIDAGWIIDLRLNEGGNVYPMLSGLGDLLGDGVPVRSVGYDGTVHVEWIIRDGVLFLGEYQTSTVERRCAEASGRGRVAVLVGPATLSSGQLTAAAFWGWDRARLFGLPTADGYATANQWHQITPELALNVSISLFEDRSGRIHPAIILPHEEIPGSWDFERLDQDPVVHRALAWLREGTHRE